MQDTPTVPIQDTHDDGLVAEWARALIQVITVDAFSALTAAPSPSPDESFYCVHLRATMRRRICLLRQQARHQQLRHVLYPTCARGPGILNPKCDQGGAILMETLAGRHPLPIYNPRRP